MDFYDTLQRETATQRAALLRAPIIAAALAGRVTRASYIAFLTEAYHHVKHTVPLLMAVGARLPERLGWLRKAVAEYIAEEIGHEEWILADIAACGGDAEAVRRGEAGNATEGRRGQAGIATELMVAYAYHTADRGHPAGFFGMVQVLEGTSVDIALTAADTIQRALGLPDAAFTYLRSHGILDRSHLRFFEELMNRLGEEGEAGDRQAVLHGARVFYRLYGDIFRALPVPGLEMAL